MSPTSRPRKKTQGHKSASRRFRSEIHLRRRRSDLISASFLGDCSGLFWVGRALSRKKHRLDIESSLFRSLVPSLPKPPALRRPRKPHPTPTPWQVPCFFISPVV